MTETVRGNFEIDTTAPWQLVDLLQVDLPNFLDLFETRSLEYGENAFVLGSRGQFADMWRKMGKLRTGLWDGQEEKLTSEGVEEILMDLIGHCFLTLQCRRQEREDQDRPTMPIRGEHRGAEEPALAEPSANGEEPTEITTPLFPPTPENEDSEGKGDPEQLEYMVNAFRDVPTETLAAVLARRGGN